MPWSSSDWSGSKLAEHLGREALREHRGEREVGRVLHDHHAEVAGPIEVPREEQVAVLDARAPVAPRGRAAGGPAQRRVSMTKSGLQRRFGEINIR